MTALEKKLRKAPKASTIPFRIANGAALSTMPAYDNPMEIVQILKGAPDIWAELRNTIRPPEEDGATRANHRPPKPGYWELALVAFVASGKSKVKSWYGSPYVTESDWTTILGFDEVPSYATVQRQFARMEAFEPDFALALASVIKRCQEHVAAIGAWIHVDSTEAHTHAQLQHDCLPGRCGVYKDGKYGAGVDDELPEDPAAILAKATELRAPVNPDDADDDGNISAAGPDMVTVLIDYDTEVRGITRRILRIWNGSHWMRTSDLDAGTRVYRRSSSGALLKRWRGYYATSAVCHVIGLPLTTRLFSAATNEADIYPQVIEYLKVMHGQYPIAAAMDRGFGFDSVYSFNTERNIATVAPYRRTSANDTGPEETDLFDRHGVPKCRHCGRSGNFVWAGLVSEKTADGGKSTRPQIRFKCAVGGTDACKKIQTINPAHSWRRLVPIWRTSPVYSELRSTHSNYEFAHHQQRNSHGVGPTSVDRRPHRVGIACQQLHATVGLLTNWLIVADARGWLGGPCKRRITVVARDGEAYRINREVMQARKEDGLTGGHVPIPAASQVIELDPNLPREKKKHARHTVKDGRPVKVDQVARQVPTQPRTPAKPMTGTTATTLLLADAAETVIDDANPDAVPF